MMDETPRMWIDMTPPPEPADGDVWVRLGEMRVWDRGEWDPPWLSDSPVPRSDTPPWYPKRGRRKKRDDRAGAKDR